MRSMLLLALLLLAGCKIDWAGPDLSCLSPSEAEACPAPPLDTGAPAPVADTSSVRTEQVA